jgi:hypothetical protein
MKPKKHRVSDILPGRPSKHRRVTNDEASVDNDEGADAPITEPSGSPLEGQNVDMVTRTALGGVSPHTITPHTSFHDLPRRVSYLADDDLATTRLVNPPGSGAHVSPSVSSEENDAAVGLEIYAESDSVHSLLIAGQPVQHGAHSAHPALMSTMEEGPSTATDWVLLRLDTSQQACRLVVEGKRWKLQTLLFGLAALLYVVLGCSSSTVPNIAMDKNSVYVPGGGFSGFWYTLGRLNSIDLPLSKNYYCYSAGCLGLVAMLSNTTMETAYDVAVDAQKQWQRGEVSRYDVTEMFIDGIFYGLGTKERSERNLRPELKNPDALRTLNIITSVQDGWGGLKASIRTPSNTAELKEMLLQTAWIPFATSRDLWHEEHMDGAFTLLDHPQCAHHLGYAAEIDMMLNALNVNLSREKVALYWERGLAQGL